MSRRNLLFFGIFFIFFAMSCGAPDKVVQNKSVTPSTGIEVHRDSRHEAVKATTKFLKAMNENDCKGMLRFYIHAKQKIKDLQRNTPTHKWDEIEDFVAREHRDMCDTLHQTLKYGKFTVDENFIEENIPLRNEMGQIIGETPQFIVFATVEYPVREKSIFNTEEDGLIRIMYVKFTFVRFEGEFVSNGFKSLSEHNILWPNDEQTRILLARYHLKKGNISRALEVLGGVETSIGKKWRANFLYRKSSRYLFSHRPGTPARSEMREALQLDPSLKALLKRDACIYLKQGRRIALDVLREFLPGETCDGAPTARR